MVSCKLMCLGKNGGCIVDCYLISCSPGESCYWDCVRNCINPCYVRVTFTCFICLIKGCGKINQ